MREYDAIARMNQLAECHIPFLVLVDFEKQRSLVLTMEELIVTGIRFSFRGQPHTPYASAPPFTFSFQPPDQRFYEQQFQRVRQALQRGETYVLNLTGCSSVETSWSLPELFANSRAPYKILMPNEWVCFSPEGFVTIENGVIATFPMKGTADATQPKALELLLADEKELAEHVTVVDLLRNDLAQVATKVEVKRFRFVTYVETERHRLIQLSSEIQGRLAGGYEQRLGEIFFSLLPAGSVCGAPKKRTLELIREVEGEARGFYTGVAGWFDGHRFDSCVLIRFLEQRGTKYVYRSGGGITLGSTAAREYQELTNKVYVPLA